MKTAMIAMSDFKERSRRFSFWAMAALALFAAVIFVPRPMGTFRVLILDADVYRQASNPTWIPMGAALMLGLLLPLVGFVYVKNAVGADRQTGTMSLLLSGRLPRFRYTLGKFFSSVLLLFALLGVVMLGSAAMVVLNFPGWAISPWVIVSPFLALVPGLVFVAALALFAETTPILRTGGGNILCIIGLLQLIIMGIGRETSNVFIDTFSISGYQWLMGMVNETAIAVSGRPIQNFTVLGGGDWIPKGGEQELVFGGVNFLQPQIIYTGLLLLASLVLVLAAALLLERRPLKNKAQAERRRARFVTKPAVSVPAGLAHWHPVAARRFSFVRLMAAEANCILQALTPVWFIPALGLWVAGWFVPVEVGENVLYPLLLGWAILPLSALGCEEVQTGVYTWLRTVKSGPMRQMLASYASAVVFVLLLCLPFAARPAAPAASPAFLALAFAVPAVALFCGRFSKTQRPFQILLIVWLYIYLNVPTLFIPQTFTGGVAVYAVYLLLSVVAVGLLVLEQLRVQK